ncbi:hypothetical protein BDR26DRAFT_861608 [Obelidium mucronatum]|nr:hypothetical protein BDR26DRAFT_862878 [Obelidium mucronatum]KAI9340274.1 hypothetical protein BDR26DRAFT_861608 [Obelidium mucronatum]
MVWCRLHPWRLWVMSVLLSQQCWCRKSTLKSNLQVHLSKPELRYCRCEIKLNGSLSRRFCRCPEAAAESSSPFQ